MRTYGYWATVRIALCIIGVSVFPSCLKKQVPPQGGFAAPKMALTVAPSTLPENPFATVRVDPLHLGAKIPQSFLGFSFDYPEVEKTVGTIRNPLPAFVNMLNQLRRFNGPLVLRIGGDAQDESWFSDTHTQPPRNVRFTITSSLVQALDAAAQATQSKLILGLNLGADDPSILLNWIEAAQNDFLPEQILAFELGNEPDNYQNHFVNDHPLREKPWDYALYSKQFDHYKEMLRPHLKAKKPLAAPSFAGSFIPDAQNFIERESMDLAAATLHYYPLNGCRETAPPLNESQMQRILLANDLSHFFYDFNPILSISKRLSVPLRIDEAGPVSCDGFPEVGNSFASGLWSLQFMLDFAHEGGAGINFRASSTIGPQPQAAPIFYAMLFFGEAVQNNASFIPIAINGPRNIRAWATIDRNGMVRVILVNASPVDGKVVVRIPHTRGSARIIRLAAPSPSARTGVTLAGQTFDQSSDGDLVGVRTEEILNPTKQLFPVSLPADSAALISAQFSPR